MPAPWQLKRTATKVHAGPPRPNGLASRRSSSSSTDGCPRDRSNNDVFHILLPSSWFVVCWWTVAWFHACAIAFLTAMTWLYVWLLLQEPYDITSTLYYLRFDFSNNQLQYSPLWIIIWVFALTGALHLHSLVRSIRCSFHRHELTFCSTETLKSSQHHFLRFHTLSSCNLMALMKKNWIDPVLSIHGRYFDRYFVFKEYLEVACQVYQAYQMSMLIPTRWVNHVFVIMIAVNCLATPVIHWLVPSHNMPLRRLLNVTFSAFLNFINSMVIPLLLFLPYVKVFNVKHDGTYGMPLSLLSNTLWKTRAINENQQLFVTSYLDFVATWLPHWSVFSCLLTCEQLLRRCPRGILALRGVATIRGPLFPVEGSPAPDEREHSAPSHFSPRVSKRTECVAHQFLWVIGLIVVAIHVVAQSREQVGGCILPSTPWFVTKSSCILMQINCTESEIEGKEQELDRIFSHLHSESLTRLALVECPSLQMPPVVRSFRHLEELSLEGCTLDQWPPEASLSQHFHPRLTTINVDSVSLSGLPEGLMDKAFPSSVNAIWFCNTNLTTLPENLHERWQAVETIGFEFGLFDRFPSTLSRMPTLYLYLDGNPMATADSGLFLNESVQYLDMSTSMLSSLPSDSMGDLGEQVYALLFMDTALTEVPVYVREWYLDGLKRAHNKPVHLLVGSPYCNRTISPDDEDQLEYQKRVCGLFDADDSTTSDASA